MSTINEHVSALRIMLKQEHDDSRYTDQLLYKKLNDARLLLLRRRLTNRSTLSRFNYNTWCTRLEQVKFFDCSCISNTNCLVLRSKTKIPKTLTGRYTDLFNVYNYNGRQLGNITSLNELHQLQLTYTRRNKPTSFIMDGYLYIFNNNFLRSVVVEAVWEDVLDLSHHTICDSNGNSTTELCFDPLTSDFPIDGDLHEDLYRIAADSIIQLSNIPDDKVNDQEESTGV